MDNWKKDISFKILTGFFSGREVVCGDCVWTPTSTGDVIVKAGNNEPIRIEAFDAAIQAGRLVEGRIAWGDSNWEIRPVSVGDRV